MHTGYLSIETHPGHPHIIRTRAFRYKPDADKSDDGGRIRYTAWFEDIDAGEMHLHEFLRHSLIDINNRLYRTKLTTAIADIESIRLRHKCIWRDPDLTPGELQTIDTLQRQIKKRQDRVERLINIIGYGALVLLCFNLLVLLVLT